MFHSMLEAMLDWKQWRETRLFRQSVILSVIEHKTFLAKAFLNISKTVTSSNETSYRSDTLVIAKSTPRYSSCSSLKGDFVMMSRNS